MGKILGIGIHNYGSLKDVAMGRLYSDQSAPELGNMVAAIGSSGSGKSTLADAFGFLSDCITFDVPTACRAGYRGGYDQLVSQGAVEPLRFELYYRENEDARPITYELTIAKDGTGRPCVHEERLRQRVKKMGRPLTFLHLVDGEGYAFVGADTGQDDEDQSETHEGKESIKLNDTRRLGVVTLGQLYQYPRIEKFLQFLQSWYLCYFSPDTARQAESAEPTPYLDRTGGNLNNVARYLNDEDPEAFRRMLADIQGKIPNIGAIQPVVTAGGEMRLLFQQRDLPAPIPSPRMSDGTLKLVAYYLLLNEQNPRQLVFIEEPENGLYPQYLAFLAGEMARNVNANPEKQLFVTTHSPSFVNGLSPDQVWVLTKTEDGFTTARRASSFKFVDSMYQEEITLGDLWASDFFR